MHLSLYPRWSATANDWCGHPPAAGGASAGGEKGRGTEEEGAPRGSPLHAGPGRKPGLLLKNLDIPWCFEYLNITSLLTFDSLRLFLYIAMIGRGSRYCMITAASISTAAVCLKHRQENAVTDQEKTIQHHVSSIYSDMGKTVLRSEIKKCAFVLPAHYINIVGDFYTTNTELREWA